MRLEQFLLWLVRGSPVFPLKTTTQLLIPSCHPVFSLSLQPLSWVCPWWGGRTLPSGWQCVTAEGRTSGPTSPGSFPKMPKAKRPWAQSTKGASGKPGWLISFHWPCTRGRTWPVCTGPRRRRAFTSPNTVRNIWASRFKGALCNFLQACKQTKIQRYSWYKK